MSYTKKRIEAVFRSKVGFVEGNSAELLWRTPNTFERIFETVLSAKQFICLEFYIFRNDDTGIALAEILKQKAREGVSVYIMYDHLGSIGTPISFWADLKKSGVRVRAFNPFIWFSPGMYFHRDHRKLIIVDGTTAFVGGLNIADEYRGIYIPIKKKEPWRDTGVVLQGPVAIKLFDTFKKAWRSWLKDPIKKIVPIVKEMGSLPVLPIFAHSIQGRIRLRRLLYYSIRNANKEIALTTAYFTPSRKMLRTLESAVSRGVRVRLLVPFVSDVPAAYYAGAYFFNRLLEAGVEIYTYHGRMLHAKTYVFDYKWSIVGSANLDYMSLKWNDEGNVGILDERFAREMLAVFEEDLQSANKLDKDEWKKRPLCKKMKERFFALFRRRL